MAKQSSWFSYHPPDNIILLCSTVIKMRLIFAMSVLIGLTKIFLFFPCLCRLQSLIETLLHADWNIIPDSCSFHRIYFTVPFFKAYYGGKSLFSHLNMYHTDDRNVPFKIFINASILGQKNGFISARKLSGVLPIVHHYNVDTVGVIQSRIEITLCINVWPFTLQ